MGEQGSSQVPRETTKEEKEEDDPLSSQYGGLKYNSRKAYFEITDQSITERVCIQSVLEDGGRDVGQTREDDDT